jgi:hypothetical protein
LRFLDLDAQDASFGLDGLRRHHWQVLSRSHDLVPALLHEPVPRLRARLVPHLTKVVDLYALASRFPVDLGRLESDECDGGRVLPLLFC